MRKHFRIVKNGFGYVAEMNTRWAIGDRFLDNPRWEDNWMPMGLTHQTIDEAQKDIEDYKISTQFEVVYEE
jgi:hypothetical protein